MLKLFYLLISCVQAFTFKDCGSTHLFPNNVIINPENPNIGDNTTIYIKGYSDEIFESGTVDVIIKISSIPLYTLNLDFCKVSNCPLKVNDDFLITYNIEIPSFAPKGLYDFIINIIDNNKKYVGCVEINTKLNIF